MTNASRINRYFCWCSLICHLFPFHLLKALVINFNLVTLYVFGISINHAIVHKWKAVVLEDVTICKTFMVRQLIEPDIKHFFLGLISKPLIAYIIKKVATTLFDTSLCDDYFCFHEHIYLIREMVCTLSTMSIRWKQKWCFAHGTFPF